MRFGGIVALDGVSFDIGKGQILGLIGPNGAGKTTLFNCLSRLYTPTTGDILFEGRSHPRSACRTASPTLGIGRTFQNLALFRTMSVLDNVLVGSHSRSRSDFASDALRLPGCAAAKRAMIRDARELIAYLDLERCRATAASPTCPSARRSASSLRARSPSQPKLLLLDEPAGGLNHDEVGGLGAPDPRIRDERSVTDPARRASHGPGDVDLRQGRGARSSARRSPKARRRWCSNDPERDPRLSRDHAE